MIQFFNLELQTSKYGWTMLISESLSYFLHLSLIDILIFSAQSDKILIQYKKELIFQRQFSIIKSKI